MAGFLAPEDAFGGAEEGPPHRVSRFAFPRDAELEKGMHFLVDRDGQHVDYWVESVEGETVFARPTHPLAGTRVRYWAEVVEVREATETELEHGHPIA